MHRRDLGATRPTLFVANHISYLDITVLGALIARSASSPRREVASWPFFGWLAKLQRTVFVDRQPRSTAQDSATRSPAARAPATT